MKMVPFIPPSQRKAILFASDDRASVLISGALGTGKSSIARWIHTHSPRSHFPFHTANLERPLAPQIQKAQGGSLWIPEISALSLSEQKLLLRYLRTSMLPHPNHPEMNQLFRPTRILSATTYDLEKRTEGGLFNKDLFQKLSTYWIQMPPLHKRRDEFPEIVRGLLREITHDLHKEYLKGLSDSAWQLLQNYSWPGNIRELRNVLRVATTEARGEFLEKENFPNFKKNEMNFHAMRDDFEKTYFQTLLKQFHGDIDKAANATQVDKKVFLEKIKRYTLD